MADSGGHAPQSDRADPFAFETTFTLGEFTIQNGGGRRSRFPTGLRRSHAIPMQARPRPVHPPKVLADGRGPAPQWRCHRPGFKAGSSLTRFAVQSVVPAAGCAPACSRLEDGALSSRGTRGGWSPDPDVRRTRCATREVRRSLRFQGMLKWTPRRVTLPDLALIQCDPDHKAGGSL